MLVLSLSNTSLAAHNIAIGAKVNGSIFALSDNGRIGNRRQMITVRRLTRGPTRTGAPSTTMRPTE